MVESFKRAREIDPEQPLSVCVWNLQGHMGPDQDNEFMNSELDRTVLGLSDIITFHAYCNADMMKRIIKFTRRYERPMICTEWLARHVGCSFETILPLFRQENIGCYHWGLVEGRTQTFYPWPNVKEKYPDTWKNMWFHDVLRKDGSPYSRDEMDMVGSLTARRA